MQTFLLVALGIILFQLLVVLHEYGHFLVAKRNGVEVEEFGLGFPPRMVGKVMGKGIFRSLYTCLLYTSPSPRDRTRSRMPSSA